MAGKSVSGRPFPQPSAEEQRYRGEDDLRTLTRAHEVRNDGSRLANVRKVHADQLRALQGVGRTLSGAPQGSTVSVAGRPRRKVRKGVIKGRSRKLRS